MGDLVVLRFDWSSQPVLPLVAWRATDDASGAAYELDIRIDGGL